MWRKGRVEELVRGKDKMVRGAVLQVVSKGGQQGHISRPLEKLVPFEIANEIEKWDEPVKKVAVNDNREDIKVPVEKQNNVTVIDQKCVNEPSSSSISTKERPKRKAAREGEQKRRLLGQFGI